MVDVKNDAQNTAGNEDGKSVFVNNNAAVTTVSTSRISKILKSQDGKIRRSTTVSSRTITRTNNSIGANIHSLNLTGMDSSTVVSAGSGSSPSINNFVGNLNTHGVFGFDAFNQLPTDGDLIKWISDSDSFIKEFNLWSMQNQVAQSGCEDTPGCCNDASMQIASEESLNNHNQDNQVSNVSSENTASGPENIEITHAPILSQKAEASHV
jgi:hypothetical protein